MSWLSVSFVAALGGIALKSMVVLAGAFALAALLRNASAARRHLVWTAAAAALVALPLLMTALPKWHVPVASVLPESNLVFRAIGVAPVTPATETVRPASPAPRTAASAVPWNTWFAAFWLAGTAFGALRMVAAAVHVARLRRKSVPVESEDMQQLCGLLGIRHRVELLVAGEGVMPMACGILLPAILLPAEASQWTPERRRVVLLHELAHVERGDLATHLLARLALLLYWWNPLAWLGWREFLKERERAADDLVLQMGTDAPGYASHLLDIARAMQTSSPMAVAMARKSELEGRMIAILDSKIDRKGAGAVLAGAAVALAVLVSVPLASVQAQESKSIISAEAPKDGPGLIRYANQLRRQGKRDEAEAAYRNAAEQLGDKPEAAEAYAALGIMAFTRKDFAAAEELLKRAQLLDPGKSGVATMWTAMLREREARTAEAESLFQSALAIQDKNSQEAATTMELYAYLLERANRSDEASLMKERALAIRKQTETPVYAEAPRGEVHKMGGSVEKPSLVSKIEPVYTDEARAAHYQGTVVLSIEIHPDGKPHNVRVVRGLGLGLNEQAMDAVSRWQFRPGTKDGQPVTVGATIEVNWRLL
ncbi:MAG: TonB family protein [Bryobacteraceae bacterium]